MVRVFRSFIQSQGRVTSILLGMMFFLISSNHAFAENIQEVETMIQTVCSNCHKFQGKGESRFNLKAPDLMWGGQQVST